MTELILHQALLNPESYPDAPSRIVFRETHISNLYFTDTFVYKVKKPKDYGFLNFTTLDRRRFYCHEEVRLNRRFCPGTYLGVRAIRRTAGGFSFGGSGEVVEYAVQMKRLPESAMLVNLLKCPAAALKQRMTDLGRLLAKHHRASKIHDPSDPCSDLNRIQRNWRENFAQIAEFTGEMLTANAYRTFLNYVEGFLERNRPLLLRRQSQGWVRDGHGDLHAEHICLTEPIRIFDCIEFNQCFRLGDVLSDLAFLLMDLDFRRRRDLGEVLLKSYLEEFDAGDRGMDLIPFYKIYRAFVRGKVEAFLAHDRQAGADTRHKAEARARNYFRLARGYLCSQLLILTCGLMGTGKTTIAKALAGHLGAHLWRSDELRREPAAPPREKIAPSPYGEGRYRPELTAATYDRLHERAEQTLQEGKTVIADASFSEKARRDRFRQLAVRHQVPCLILAVECPVTIARRRMAERWQQGRDASEGRPELLSRQAKHFQPLENADDILRLDGLQSVDRNIDLIIDEIIRRSGSIRSS